VKGDSHAHAQAANAPPVSRSPSSPERGSLRTPNNLRGEYAQPDEELSIRNFAISLHARAMAFAKLKH
jgi:hypothetical protein